MTKNKDILLDVKNLTVHYFTDEGVVKAAENVSFTMYRGEILGIVGESGSGKTTMSLAVIGLVPKPGKILEGEILLDGENLLCKSEKEMEAVRGRRIAVIWQDPSATLNPVLSIGFQTAEIILTHEKEIPKDEAIKRAIKFMELVGIPSASDRAKDYPHQFSGGMKQRTSIATSLTGNPELIIADEPTSSVDVITQAQILEIFQQLKRERNLSIMLITHDLGLAAELCDRIAIMYAGRILEIGDIDEVFEQPLHPYTQALLASIPRVDLAEQDPQPIVGSIPDPINLPIGCKFHPRCSFMIKACTSEEPQLKEVLSGRLVRCIRVNKFLES